MTLLHSPTNDSSQVLNPLTKNLSSRVAVADGLFHLPPTNPRTNSNNGCSLSTRATQPSKMRAIPSGPRRLLLQLTSHIRMCSCRTMDMLPLPLTTIMGEDHLLPLFRDEG